MKLSKGERAVWAATFLEWKAKQLLDRAAKLRGETILKEKTMSELSEIDQLKADYAEAQHDRDVAYRDLEGQRTINQTLANELTALKLKASRQEAALKQYLRAENMSERELADEHTSRDYEHQVARDMIEEVLTGVESTRVANHKMAERVTERLNRSALRIVREILGAADNEPTDAAARRLVEQLKTTAAAHQRALERAESAEESITPLRMNNSDLAAEVVRADADRDAWKARAEVAEQKVVVLTETESKLVVDATEKLKNARHTAEHNLTGLLAWKERAEEAERLLTKVRAERDQLMERNGEAEHPLVPWLRDTVRKMVAEANADFVPPKP